MNNRNDIRDGQCDAVAARIIQPAAIRRRAFLVAASAAAAWGAWPPAHAATGWTAGRVYTADELGNSLSEIDLASGRVTTMPLPISPHNVEFTRDGRWLLAVGDLAGGGHAHGASGRKGRLLVFDADDLSAGVVANVEVGLHPAHVVSDSASRRAFVTNAGDDSLLVVDLAQRRLTGSVRTGRYPHGLRLSPDGREVHVACVRDGSVSIIDTATLTETARVPVGKTPVQVGFTPDGQRVYVSLRDENRVAVLDVARRTVEARIEVGSQPIQVHASVDGRLVYVANQGATQRPADTVSVIDVASARVVETMRTGLGAHGVAVSADGKRVFVTNIVDGTVSEIDTATHRVLQQHRVGKGPNGITHRNAVAKAVASGLQVLG
jgi:YVTN family beta-propeller protein